MDAVMSSDRTELDALEEALAAAYDAPTGERTAMYHKGYTAALRFARICILDQMAIIAMDFTNASGNGERWTVRHRTRTLAALRTISQRLSEALRSQPNDDVAAGYRDGIRVALELTTEQERAVQQREQRCATLTG
ncbi:hypothetical protein [Mycolicibacterium pulveris]|uniref:hypothetical protein n=1 Tax=Mycolicibacterium pulveris TaxID=36813 RepID=UPI003CED8BC6